MVAVLPAWQAGVRLRYDTLHAVRHCCGRSRRRRPTHRSACLSLQHLARQGMMRAGGLFVKRWKPPPLEAVRRVVLIRPDHLGDVLLLTPALARLREALPDVDVTLYVDPGSCPVAYNGPEGVHIEAHCFPGITRGPKPHPVRPYVDLWFMAQHLKAGNYDAALILRPDHWWGGGTAGVAGLP